MEDINAHLLHNQIERGSFPYSFEVREGIILLGSDNYGGSLL